MDTHELYKDFLEYAVDQGVDLDNVQEMYDLLYESGGMSDRAACAVLHFEELMYDFLGVDSMYDDPRMDSLMEAPGIYEINHPFNFRGKE